MPTLRTLLRVGSLLSLSLLLVGTAHAKKKKKKKPMLPWTAVAPTEGHTSLDVLAEVNLSQDSALKPFSIAPDIKYGVTKEFSIGAIHSGYGTEGFYGGVGNGLCLSGESNGCYSIYPGFGAEAVYKFPVDGPVNMGATVGFVTRGIGLDGYSANHLKVGVKGRYLKKPTVFWFQPHFMLSMGDTDLAPHYLVAPVSVGLLSGSGFIPFVQSGFRAVLSSGGDDNIQLPLTVGGMYKPEREMWVGGTFTIHNIAAQAAGPLDSRAINLNFGTVF